jgi:hypothetical protein
MPYEPFVHRLQEQLTLLSRVTIEHWREPGIGALVVCNPLKETLSCSWVLENIEFVSAQEISCHSSNRFDINESRNAH